MAGLNLETQVDERDYKYYFLIFSSFLIGSVIERDNL